MKKSIILFICLFSLMTQSVMGQACRWWRGRCSSRVFNGHHHSCGDRWCWSSSPFNPFFVEEPKDHLKNILVGGAIGVIIGVGIVAYKQASVSKEVFYEGAQISPDFRTLDRTAWHSREQKKLFFEFNKL